MNNLQQKLEELIKSKTSIREEMHQLARILEENQNKNEVNSIHGLSNYLLDASKIMAIYAVQEEDPSWIGYALICLAHVSEQPDYQETLMRLAIVNNSAEKIGSDIRLIWDPIKNKFKGKTELIDSFLTLPSNKKELNLFGYKEVHRNGAFEYKRTI
jgi:hypothetical protein